MSDKEEVNQLLSLVTLNNLLNVKDKYMSSELNLSIVIDRNIYNNYSSKIDDVLDKIVNHKENYKTSVVVNFPSGIPNIVYIDIKALSL